MPLSKVDKANIHVLSLVHKDLTFKELAEEHLGSHLQGGVLYAAAENRFHYLKRIKAQNQRNFWDLHKKAIITLENRSTQPKVEADEEESATMDDDEVYDDHPALSSPKKAKKVGTPRNKSSAASKTAKATRGTPGITSPPANISIKSPSASVKNKQRVKFESIEEAIDYGTPYVFFFLP